jgi:S-adenosylmethionine synthetase
VYKKAVVNPLGDWTGGTDVDTGRHEPQARQRHGDSVTGGGLHGKDLSKADVSVNIWAWLKAQETGTRGSCAAPSVTIRSAAFPYAEIVETARQVHRGARRL